MHTEHFWPGHYKHDSSCLECLKMVYVRPLIWRIGCYLQHTWFLRSVSPKRKLKFEYNCNFCGAELLTEKELRRQDPHPFCQLGLHEWTTCDMGCCGWWCDRGCHTKYDYSEGIRV